MVIHKQEIQKRRTLHLHGIKQKGFLHTYIETCNLYRSQTWLIAHKTHTHTHTHTYTHVHTHTHAHTHMQQSSLNRRPSVGWPVWSGTHTNKHTHTYKRLLKPQVTSSWTEPQPTLGEVWARLPVMTASNQHKPTTAHSLGVPLVSFFFPSKHILAKTKRQSGQYDNYTTGEADNERQVAAGNVPVRYVPFSRPMVSTSWERARTDEWICTLVDTF